jgi:hypothetical protein
VGKAETKAIAQLAASANKRMKVQLPPSPCSHSLNIANNNVSLELFHQLPKSRTKVVNLWLWMLKRKRK